MSLNQPLKLIDTILLLHIRQKTSIWVCVNVVNQFTSLQRLHSNIQQDGLPLYHLSSFSFELKETPPHFQIDQPAYLECLSYSADEEVRKMGVNAFNLSAIMSPF